MATNTLKALDQTIKANGIKYRVIGVLKDKGSSAFFNADNIVLTTYNNIRRLFPTDGISYNIGIMVNNINEMDAAIAEAKGTFRPIRRLAIDEENNFYIFKSDTIAEVFQKRFRFNYHCSSIYWFNNADRCCYRSHEYHVGGRK